MTDRLAPLVAQDATRPRVTWYDDLAGPTAGERVELSARVLATWTAKAANLLVDDLDVQRGDVVRLALPAHWRTLYWALACWRVGAVVTFGRGAGDSAVSAPDVVVTDDPTGDAAAPAGSVVAVSLPALARGWTGPALPRGVVDEAAELPGHGDVFVPVDEPGPDDVALAADAVTAERLTAARLTAELDALAAERGWTGEDRVLVAAGSGQPAWPALRCVLAAWAAGGSAVLCRDASAEALAARSTAERVTSACDPAGRPASRS